MSDLNNQDNLKLLPRIRVEEMMQDAAFRLSVETRDVVNMQKVLRAYGYQFSSDAAEYAIFFGEDYLAQ